MTVAPKTKKFNVIRYDTQKFTKFNSIRSRGIQISHSIGDKGDQLTPGFQRTGNVYQTLKTKQAEKQLHKNFRRKTHLSQFGDVVTKWKNEYREGQIIYSFIREIQARLFTKFNIFMV